MSHISVIEIQINNLEILKKVCDRLGFEFLKNQKSYQWYGTWVGRFSLPEGITENQLGKCDHAIRVPNCRYEIGVVKRGDHFILLWDSWRKGGLTKAIGKRAGVLKQAYAVERVRNEARRKGYRLIERDDQKNIRLVLTL